MVPVLIALLFLQTVCGNIININAPPIFQEGESFVHYKNDEFSILDVALGGYSTVVLTNPSQAQQWGIDKKVIDFPEEIESLSCGGYHCLALSKTGKVYEWGQRDSKVERITQPQLIEEFDGKKIVKVSAGFRHNIAITEQGEVYSWGETLNGKVASSEMSEEHIRPTLVRDLPVPIVDGSCGGDHTILLDNEGFLWSFGSNTDGQLGRGSQYVYCYDPMSIIKYDEKTHQLSAGGDHTLLISESKKAYSFGWGEKGQLGHGTFENQLTPKEIVLPNNEIPVEVATGAYGHSLVLTKQGNVYSFGLNDFGQLGLESSSDTLHTPTKIESLKNVKHIYGGGFKHTAALTFEGALVLFGDNTFGQLGPKFQAPKNNEELISQLEALNLL